jgi:anti-sigma-K factor RskA
MRYDNAELVERLAAEYVLGTLVGRARARFEALAERHELVRERRDHWDRRLNALADAATPIQPPPGAWNSVFARIAPVPSTQEGRHFIEQLSFWRRASFTTGFVAAALAVVLILPVVQKPVIAPASKQYVVLMRDQRQMPIWTIETDAGRAMLRVHKTGSIDMPKGTACYLWIERGGSGEPELLGVLPDQGMGEIEVPEELRPMLPGKLLVSIESVSGPSPGVAPNPIDLDSEWMRSMQGA